MSYDLWAEASASHEEMAREAALVSAETQFGDVFPFLAMARTDAEFGHRLAIAADRLEVIAAANGVAYEDIEALATRRWQLMREALAEGQDPVANTCSATDGGFGSGPEKGYGHSEGPDFSGDYAEIPQGAPGGPDPKVVQVRPPSAGPVQEATGSLRRQADSNPGAMMTAPYTTPMAPDTGTSPSVDTGTAPSGGMTPSLPAGVQDGSVNQPINQPPNGQVTSVRDPVRRRVMTVTAAIAASNPHLPPAEHERVARLVVGRYLRHADLDSSVMDNDPSDGGSGSQNGGGGHSGMSGLEEYGLGRAVVKALPALVEVL